MSNVTSQSELTTKEIVEQAISDYHESIFPYLNGQVPTIANKFDKANLYSTDEQIVGRWIDGKPLYQKTVSLSGTYTGSANGIDIGYNPNTMYMINLEIIARDSNFNNIFVLPSPDRGVFIEMYDSPIGTLSLRLGSNSLKDIMVTYQYTKTTDEAIAIGSDTDYSTTEKIVGTWIDGKPLYQKTIEMDAPTSTGSVAHNIANIDEVAYYDATIKSPNNTSFLNVPYDNGTEKYFIKEVNKTNITCYISGSFGGKLRITIQYTKTTDA